MTTAMIIVLAISVLAVALFIFEPFPLDVCALVVLVILVVFGRWTGVGPEEAISGFSNPATITVLALLMMSEGVRRTGVVQMLGQRISGVVGSSQTRQLAATIGLSGPVSSVMNNTPVVALLLPVVSEMAHKGKISPSKLLIPLSYASMLGGTLTLIGTSTNILASTLSERILGHRIGMFEFTELGAIVFVVGAAYLMLAAPRLLPERIAPHSGYLDEFAVPPDQILEVADFDSFTEIVVPAGSDLIGRTIAQVDFPERYHAYVVAVRSGGDTTRERLDERELHGGDTLLVQTTEEGNERMQRSAQILVVSADEGRDIRPGKLVPMLVIVVAMVTLAAFDILPIVISALAGVVAMLLTGVLRPAEMYRGVDWRVIFLLAGIIPLGVALEQTGTAAYLGHLLGQTAEYLPAIVVLWLFYIGTGLVTEVISNNAAVLLMLPVAAATAEQIGANPFAFVLAVMFAASTAFLGPVGYQTNLFVYGPGGYRVSDFVRVGAPLQLLLSVVTVTGIDLIWGV